MDSKERNRKLDRLRRLARTLDDAVHIPGTNVRIGLDAIIGLVPGGGDLLTALVSGYFVYEAWQMGLPVSKLLLMLLNIAIDALIGAIPVLGDLFDVAWKANIRNLRIIEDSLSEMASDHPIVATV